VPLASRVGVTAATTGYAVASVVAYRAAGHLSAPVGDRRFAVTNGLFASAVIAHLTSWPKVIRAGLPWLTECEGLEGRLVGPYNALLYLSAVAAVGGAIENRRAWRWFVMTPVVVVPVLRWETPRSTSGCSARQPRSRIGGIVGSPPPPADGSRTSDGSQLLMAGSAVTSPQRSSRPFAGACPVEDHRGDERLQVLATVPWPTDDQSRTTTSP
jgi:hypothetical protein